ncbi:MAG: alpha/beta hydrolase [Thermoleophilaceae bacterium]
MLSPAPAPGSHLRFPQTGEQGPGAGPRAGVRIRRELRYGGSVGNTVDVYRRRVSHRRGRRPRPLPGVLLVHGGGWRYGDKRRTAAIGRALARAGFVAFSINYTLAAPGRPGYPRQPRELQEAVRWARRNAAGFGLDKRRIGALGLSAGAHLAALLATDASGPLSRGSRVRAAVTWSAPLDLTGSAPLSLARLDGPALAPAIESFLGCRPRLCPELGRAASPIAHVSADDPPMLIVNSAREMVPAWQATEMGRRLTAVGVPAKVWILPGDLHASEYERTALRASIGFLRRRLR